MMARILLLLLLSIPAFSQTERIDKKAIYHFTYVKVGTHNQIKTCGRYYTKIFIGNRRLVLHCDAVSFDMKVIRKKKVWRVRDKDGSNYSVFGFEQDGKFGMLFVPDDPTKETVVIIDHEALCL